MNERYINFEKFFEIAEIARMDPEERTTYESSLKYYRDMNNVVETAKGEGWQEGLEEGLEKGLKKGLEEGLEKGLEEGEKKKAIEIAKNCLENKIDAKTISTITGLTIDEINDLKHYDK